MKRNRRKPKKSRLINIGVKSDVVNLEKTLYDVTRGKKKKVAGEHATWMDRGLGAKGITKKDLPWTDRRTAVQPAKRMNESVEVGEYTVIQFFNREKTRLPRVIKVAGTVVPQDDLDCFVIAKHVLIPRWKMTMYGFICKELSMRGCDKLTLLNDSYASLCTDLLTRRDFFLSIKDTLIIDEMYFQHFMYNLKKNTYEELLKCLAKNYDMDPKSNYLCYVMANLMSSGKLKLGEITIQKAVDSEIKIHIDPEKFANDINNLFNKSSRNAKT